MNTENIEGKVALITGASGGIGRATALELARRRVKALALVDRSKGVTDLCREINELHGPSVAVPFCGEVTDGAFRRHVYAETLARQGLVSICVPAAGITLDELAVKTDKQTGEVLIYPEEKFRTLMEINLVAPIYWALEMVAAIARNRRTLGLGAGRRKKESRATSYLSARFPRWGTGGRSAMPPPRPGWQARRRH